MKNMGLSDDEAAVLAVELTNITWTDRFQLSPRIRSLTAIVVKLKAGADQTSSLAGAYGLRAAGARSVWSAALAPPN